MWSGFSLLNVLQHAHCVRPSGGHPGRRPGRMGQSAGEVRTPAGTGDNQVTGSAVGAPAETALPAAADGTLADPNPNPNHNPNPNPNPPGQRLRLPK